MTRSDAVFVARDKPTQGPAATAALRTAGRPPKAQRALTPRWSTGTTGSSTALDCLPPYRIDTVAF